MIYGIKKVVKYVLGTDIGGRGLAVRPDDTFVVSYPRSGNTWTRFLIANLLHPSENVSFANIERLIPDAEAQSNRYLKRTPSPRVIKSHEYFDHRYPRVIYIVRDPRDVVLSYYDFERKYRSIDDNFPLDSYVSEFVQGRTRSASWGTWGENVGTWLAAREGRPGFLLLRYEDMLKDTETSAATIARFFQIEASREQLRSAVQRSSVHEMRALERTQSREWVSTKNRRQDIPFVGSAQSERWKAKLSSAAAMQIENAWGSLLAHLGYQLMTKTKPSSSSGPDLFYASLP
jgi:hypothetical protein